METLQLTPAELELIRLKREQDDNQAKQDALKDQLEYDSYIKKQLYQVNQNEGKILVNNTRIKLFYDILVKEGVGKYIKILTRDNQMSADNYIKKQLKSEDIISKNIQILIIETKWGNIYSITQDLKSYIPSGLHSRYQEYKAVSIAAKIKEAVGKEYVENITKENKAAYKANLMSILLKDAPEGTTTEDSREYANGGGKGTGYYNDYITIKYPNKSWVKIYWSNDMWLISGRFDSKQVKPAETKEEWLQYLSK